MQINDLEYSVELDTATTTRVHGGFSGGEATNAESEGYWMYFHRTGHYADVPLYDPGQEQQEASGKKAAFAAGTGFTRGARS